MQRWTASSGVDMMIPFVGLVESCGFPPCRQKKADRMGHGRVVVERAVGWLGFVVSHASTEGRGVPSRPSGAWTGHPDFGQKKCPPVCGRRAVVFLVDSSMANSEGNRAIIFDLYVIDISSSYKLFFEKGLDKISTGAWVGLTVFTDVALRQPRP